MKSMTGFGKAVCELPQKKVTIEIRSLNSRQLDLNMRMPSQYRDKESEVRQMISRTLERGKIDVSIYSESAGEATSSAINQSLAMDSKNPFALRNKGIYYTLNGDKVSALSYLEELAVSHPDMDLVQEYLTKARAL